MKNQFNISYDKFKEIFEIIKGESEFELHFKNKIVTYMIIKYKDGVTFQKCSLNRNFDEVKYSNLDELYNANLIDGICLKNDWNKLDDIILDEIYSFVTDINEIERFIR